VWGSDEAIKDRLLKIVPLGSSPETLETAAKARGWSVTVRDEDRFRAGTPTYFNDHSRRCVFAGGPSRVVIIAEYRTPFVTNVEAYWLFDPHRRLRHICIRTTTDAL
jgi:hypothetical protein